MLIPEHLKQIKTAIGKVHILASDSPLMSEILKGIDLDIAALEKIEKTDQQDNNNVGIEGSDTQ